MEIERKIDMILMPIPDYGFDPTEAAVPWNYLKEKGIDIVIATPSGKMASADERLLTGEGFGPFKKLLMAEPSALKDYRSMTKNEAFRHPIRYSEIDTTLFTGVLLPGGHDKGMREYLESEILQKKVAEFFLAEKLIGAICHGTVLAARTIDPRTEKSVIYDYQTTSLLKSQEMGAYYLTALWLNDYYRTYSITVEEEVKSVLKEKNQFLTGKVTMSRDSIKNEKPAFVVEDRNYISARWPGDAHTFARKFYKKLSAERF